MNQENILSAAKNAKSVEELKQIAVDNGITLTDEKANFYFSLLEEKEGELTLDELAAAAGGYIGQSNYGPCSSWRCVYCGAGPRPTKYRCSGCSRVCGCQSCAYNAQRASDNTCARYLKMINEISCG